MPVVPRIIVAPEPPAPLPVLEQLIFQGARELPDYPNAIERAFRTAFAPDSIASFKCGRCGLILPIELASGVGVVLCLNRGRCHRPFCAACKLDRAEAQAYYPLSYLWRTAPGMGWYRRVSSARRAKMIFGDENYEWSLVAEWRDFMRSRTEGTA